MSTPADKLNLDGVLEPLRATLDSGRARAKRVRRQTGLDLTGVLEPVEAAAPRPASHPRNPYSADDYNLDGDWSPARAEEVKGWFKQMYRRDLPNSFGQTATHNRMGLDHSANMDVQVNPTSAEGKALREYLRSSGIPFLAYYSAKAGAATGPHIHVGNPSHGLGARSETSALNLGGIIEPLNLEGVLESVDASDPLAGLDMQEGEEAVREALPAPAPSPAPVPAPLPLNVARPAATPTAERARRDVRLQAEARGGALLRYPVGSAATPEAVKEAVSGISKETGAPAEFVESWLRGKGLGLYEQGTQKPLESSPTGYAAIPAKMVGQMRKDYDASLGVGGRLVNHLSEAGQYSAGEHALGVLGVGLPAAVAASTAPLTRPVEALDAQFFSRLNREGLGNKLAAVANPFDLQAIGDAYSTLKGERPESTRNPLAADVEADMAKLHPTVGKAYGVLADLIFSPSNAPGAAGALKYVGRFNKAVEGARAARTVEEFGAAVADAERVAAEATSLVDVERLNYARTRVAHYAQEAETASNAGARQAARELADDYAEEVTRLESGVPETGGVEGYDLTGVLEPQHHSHAQPRTIAGQFDRPPQKSKSLPAKALGLAGDAADAMKSNLYSADVSAPFRQALFPLVFETWATGKGLVEGLASVSSKQHAKFVEHVRTLPLAKEADRMGLALSSMNPEAKLEYFPSKAASKLPWVGASERVMSHQLDAVRLNVYESLTKELRAAGMTPVSHPEEYKGIARMVNIASGHGELGRLGTAAQPVLTKALGSPRLLKSRFQILNPLEYAKLPPAARRIALKKAGRTAASFASLFGLAALTADEVGVDPRKGNFGTARYGSTSYDLTGGEANKIRFIVSLVQSVGETAKVAKAGGSIKYEDTPVGVMTHFLRSQMSPAASLVPDAVTGKDYSGRDFTWSEAAARRIAPLMAQDIYDGFAAEGGKGAMKSLPAFLGASVRQLDPEKVRRDFARAMNRPAAVEVSDVAGRELKRLGVDLKKLRADVVRPGFKVEGTDGEVVTPLTKDERTGAALVPPDVLARELAEEISGAVEEAVNSPDYETFENDGARQKYLTQVVRNARARVYAGLRLKAREGQLQELERLGNYQRELEQRSRQLRPGGRMKL